MNEQELRAENQRLRDELEKMTKSRERLMEWLCHSLGFKPLTDEEIEEMLKQPRYEVHELLRDLLPPDMHDLIGESRNGDGHSDAGANTNIVGAP